LAQVCGLQRPGFDDALRAASIWCRGELLANACLEI